MRHRNRHRSSDSRVLLQLESTVGAIAIGQADLAIAQRLSRRSQFHSRGSLRRSESCYKGCRARRKSNWLSVMHHLFHRRNCKAWSRTKFRPSLEKARRPRHIHSYHCRCGNKKSDFRPQMQFRRDSLRRRKSVPHKGVLRRSHPENRE